MVPLRERYGAFRPAGPSDGGQRGGQCYALLYAFL